MLFVHHELPKRRFRSLKNGNTGDSGDRLKNIHPELQPIRMESPCSPLDPVWKHNSVASGCPCTEHSQGSAMWRQWAFYLCLWNVKCTCFISILSILDAFSLKSRCLKEAIVVLPPRICRMRSPWAWRVLGHKRWWSAHPGYTWVAQIHSYCISIKPPWTSKYSSLVQTYS